MQNVVFTGRLAADPLVSEDFARAVFRLLENRGRDREGRPRLVGVNCVSWSAARNEKVVAPGLGKGCEVVVVGAFVDTHFDGPGGGRRAAKELLVERLTVLDWARGRAGDAAAAVAAEA